jgi:galactokinase
MHPIVSSLRNIYTSKFGEQPLIFRSPGRINIIGEHTDYNAGFVLPAAIDKAVYIAIGPRNDSIISLFAVAYNESFNISLGDIAKTSRGWPNYILGVVHELQLRGYATRGFNMVIDADLPVGAGLSSSAALECATVFALNELFSLQISKMDMIDIAQKAEHTFAGVMCGIMDQFASMFGRKGFVMKLDCRSMDYEYVPFDHSGIKILMLNTNVKHTLASSEYNIRREECNKGLSWVQEAYPEVLALRDVTEQMLDQQVKPRDKVIDNRCRYVVQEIERLQLACTDLLNNDLASVGKKMLATHKGLQNMYCVSCKELDYLVDAVKNHPAVLGARMMGGGFGGCTINLVKDEFVDEIISSLEKNYETDMNLPLTAFTVEIENGTEKAGE